MQEETKNLFITGKPGSGKTTLIKELIEELKITPGGFITRELREKGQRIGFLVEDFNGNSNVLASIKINSKHRVSKYKVNLDGFERIAIPALERAKRDANLIVIDEIGKMELFSERFKKILLELLDSKNNLVLATILEADHPFCDKLKARKDVRLFKLHKESYKEIYKQIKTELEKKLKIGEGNKNENNGNRRSPR